MLKRRKQKINQQKHNKNEKKTAKNCEILPKK